MLGLDPGTLSETSVDVLSWGRTVTPRLNVDFLGDSRRHSVGAARLPQVGISKYLGSGLSMNWKIYCGMLSIIMFLSVKRIGGV